MGGLTIDIDKINGSTATLGQESQKYENQNAQHSYVQGFRRILACSLSIICTESFAAYFLKG